jgi:hypothetical protein
MPSSPASQTRNVCTYASVVYIDEVPEHLTVADVIGMGPNRPTWEQVRNTDLIIEIRSDGSLRAHDTSELGFTRG